MIVEKLAHRTLKYKTSSQPKVLRPSNSNELSFKNLELAQLSWFQATTWDRMAKHMCTNGMDIY